MNVYEQVNKKQKHWNLDTSRRGKLFSNRVKHKTQIKKLIDIDYIQNIGDPLFSGLKPFGYSIL